jgi:hypothetical protein
MWKGDLLKVCVVSSFVFSSHCSLHFLPHGSQALLLRSSISGCNCEWVVCHERITFWDYCFFSPVKVLASWWSFWWWWFRFAQFFICPLLSADATSREINAVDSGMSAYLWVVTSQIDLYFFFKNSLGSVSIKYSRFNITCFITCGVWHDKYPSFFKLSFCRNWSCCQ